MAMENKRIIQLNTERTTPAADDYVMVDSATAGTAKYLLPKITDAIDQEISDRTSADTALQTAITNEATARTNADTTLQGNITAEAIARAAADTAINGEITQLKEDLAAYNFNQRIRVNPFVKGSGIGYCAENRSNVTVLQNGGIKIARSSASPTSGSFGFYFFIANGAANLKDHKLLIKLLGIDCSGMTTAVKNIGVNLPGNVINYEISSSVLSAIVDDVRIETVSDNQNSYSLAVLLRTNTPAAAGEFFSIEAMQVIDLTEMFGVGNEPTIASFDTIFSDRAYDFIIPQNHMSTQITKALIYDEYDADIVDTDADAINTTKNYVLVTNTTFMGATGSLWFCTRDGETNLEGGITRSDGSCIYPMPDQGALATAMAPYHKIMDVVKSYVGRGDLVYGSENGLYDATCTNEIDCSSFVTAVLYGTKYSMSRYALGTDAANILGEHLGGVLMATANDQWSRRFTRGMASWFAAHKRLFTLPKSGIQACNILQFGDILFSRSGTHDTSFFGIDHAMVVIGVLPNYSRIIVAQGGGAPSTAKSNETTVCKTSLIVLDNNALAANYDVFARPDYANDYQVFNTLNVNKITAESMRFQLNSLIDGTNGMITATSGDYVATVDYAKVAPQSTIAYTGNRIDNGHNYVVRVAQYDANKVFISRSDFTTLQLTANTHYARFMFGHTEGDATTMTLAKLDDFEVTVS